MIKVGYQGVPGSFSEQALQNYFTDNKEEYNYKTFEDVFKALDEGEVTYGVLPFENSTTGAITQVYDLINKYGHYIVGETYVKINQNLLGTQDSTIEDIHIVYSHPQGFEQSTEYLSGYDWTLQPYYNTAKSAELVSEKQDPTLAAIASVKAAELYGLKVLAADINSNHLNTTRFIIIKKDEEISVDSNTISLLFSTKHQSGALLNALKHFADHGLNMLKIESRPVQHTPFEYYFYIDVEGNINDQNAKKAILEIKKDCDHFRIIGNYKKSDSVALFTK